MFDTWRLASNTSGRQAAGAGGDGATRWRRCRTCRPSASLSGLRGERWNGLGAPKGTPAEIIDKLNKEINAAPCRSQNQGAIADLGLTPLVWFARRFGKLIADETEKWGKVIRAANIKPY